MTAVPRTHRDVDDPRLSPLMLRGEMVADGWTDHAIARQVRAGVWAKVRHGAYLDGPTWRGLDPAAQHEMRGRAVVLQSKTDVVLSHVSGLPVWDTPTWGLDLSSVHVTRTDGRAGRCEAGVRQHRGVVLDGDVVEQHGVPVMHPTRLALETSMVTGVEPALVVVNDLLHRSLTTPERLAERYARGMDHWEGSLTTDVVLRLADPRIESVGESRTLYLVWKHGRGIPMPEPNYKIRDRHGNVVARVDFAWPELNAFLEFDGKVKYLKHLRPGESVTDAVLREKRRQELIEDITGWRCLRLVWVELDTPRATIARICGVLFRGLAA